MKILQWLFKVAKEQATETAAPDSNTMLMLEEKKEKECGQFEFEDDEIACNELPLEMVFTRTNSRGCFYSTLNLKVLRNFYGKGDSICIVKEDCMGHKAEATNVGSRILPICDVARSSSRDYYKSDPLLNRKSRAVSRMKELVRWAAATKSEKGANRRWKAMYFQNRGAFKAPYDEMSSSSKISSRWDMDGGSAAAFNPLSLFSSSANHRTVSTDSKQQLKPIRKGTSISSKTEGSQRKGIWITTDTDFVVLELRS